jgi:hypothetical protein
MDHYLLWGLVAHLISDWLLQNQWMADNKTNLLHPAAWVHAGIHGTAFSLVFQGIYPALVLAVAHLVLDQRQLLAWWRKAIRQTTEGPMAPHVAVWSDQAAHIACVALVAFLWRR